MLTGYVLPPIPQRLACCSVYLFTVPLAAGHVYFFISLPLAVWVSAWFGWKWAMKPEDRHSLLTLLGLSVWLTLSST